MSIYQEKLSDFAISDFYKEISHVFPNIKASAHFSAAGFITGQFVLAQNLSGAPKQFHSMLLSGIRTSQLQTDMALELKFKQAIPYTYIVDTFVLSQVTYTIRNGEILLVE